MSRHRDEPTRRRFGLAMNRPEQAWRALPISAVAALYVTGIQRFVRENLIAFFGAGTGFAVSESLGWREFVLAAGLVLLVGLLIAVIYHRRFRYRVDDDSVRVRKGLFEQQELKVRFERIQNVGFSQPIYLRPLGLVRVTLETPGAVHTEVSLPGIAAGEAVALRNRVSGIVGSMEPGPDGGGVNPEGRPETTWSEVREGRAETVVFQTGAADLFRYGMTSNQVWILLALFGAPASNWIESRLSSWFEQLESSGLFNVEMLHSAPLVIALLLGALVLCIALLIMTFSGLLAIVRFGGYQLTRDADRFKARFGLLDEREKALKAEKLHSIALVQTPVGRLLGQWHAIGHQTGVNQPGQELNEDRRFLVPGIDWRRVEDVVTALRARWWAFPEWNAIHPRFRSMLWTRISLAAAVAGILAWLAFPAGPEWPVSLILCLTLVVLFLVHLRWRRWGYAFDEQRLRIRSGVIGQTILEFDLARCQQVRLTASPYQRRHGLASITVRIPHGEQSIPYLPRPVADALVNLLLYRSERAGSLPL